MQAAGLLQIGAFDQQASSSSAIPRIAGRSWPDGALHPRRWRSIPRHFAACFHFRWLNRRACARQPGDRNRAVLTFEQFRFAFANAVFKDEAHELQDVRRSGVGGAAVSAATANLNP